MGSVVKAMASDVIMSAELMPNFTKASTDDDTGSVGVGFSAFIRDLVAPHIIPDADPRQEVYVELLDEAIRTSKLIVACVSATQAWSMSHAVACKLRCCVPKPKTPSKPEQHAERAL